MTRKQTALICRPPLRLKWSFKIYISQFRPQLGERVLGDTLYRNRLRIWLAIDVALDWNVTIIHRFEENDISNQIFTFIVSPWKNTAKVFTFKNESVILGLRRRAPSTEFLKCQIVFFPSTVNLFSQKSITWISTWWIFQRQNLNVARTKLIYWIGVRRDNGYVKGGP